MENPTTKLFSILSEDLCSTLSDKERKRERINSIIDELNALPYKTELFILKHDANTLINMLCFNINPADEFLATKTSHLMNSIIIKQKIQYSTDFLWKVMSWHIECLNKCSEILLPDILHNLQNILQLNVQATRKCTDKLIGKQGILLNILNVYNSGRKNIDNYLQIYLLVLKCILSLITILDENKLNDHEHAAEFKENLSEVITRFIMNGRAKSIDEFLYCKVIIWAIRILAHVYFHDPSVYISLPDVIGICRHFILYGLVVQNEKPERIMPSQQTVAPQTVKIATKGGKKQKLRKPRNKAIEILKKEIPVTDHSLMKDVDNFENNSVYKPITKNYLEPQKAGNCWVLTSDSDISDVENSREAKMIVLKSRLRQSAANLFLVLFKVKEKKETFGYWWALMPDCPDVNNWYADENAKKTLAYCAVMDPIASSRTSALSVILALLTSSKMYLAQAEISKKDNMSFIPFSASLGYMISCMHTILIGILDNERNQPVIIMALKCCAALVQATPYHKMHDGLVINLIRSTKRFLLHRDVTYQVGVLIVMGSIISIEPKINEILKAMEPDTLIDPISNLSINNDTKLDVEECDDFEEGYSDDDAVVAHDSETTEPTKCTDNVVNEKANKYEIGSHFKSWILDICFKNIGWLFKGEESLRCKPAAIPVMLESLQVLSSIAFHYLSELLKPHLMLLSDVLCELLQHEHHDVVLQAAKIVSVLADGIQKLEQVEQAPPLNQCVYMWGKLLTPLSSVLQCHENPSSKAIVCDCIANIGEKSFKELPSRQQLLCCALLMGSCSDEEAAVRAAAVRALAMAVMYRTLREDICFVSDCGENILRALSETTLVVRVKAAWALGNLSDALVLNMEEPELDNIGDELLVRLLEVSNKCADDNDKVKMSATRALGNLLRLINIENLQHSPHMKILCETAISKLLKCACQVNNMKVRWNACYALGNAMKNEHLFTCFSGWQDKVLQSLCALARDCKNLKVRINAAVALRACATRAHLGRQLAATWSGLMAAMDGAANLDDFTEYKHKDNLIEQLCVTLAHFCCLLEPSDLTDILDPLIFHGDCAKALYSQVYNKLPPENASCLKILQAAKYVTMDLTPGNETQGQSLGMLQEIFILDL